MKTLTIKTACFLFFATYFAQNIQAQNDWKVSLEKDAIRVYTRTVTDSKFKAYKGEILVKTSLSCLAALLDDVNHQKNWLYDCTESKRLETINEAEGINYFVQKAPWPVSDRDVIVKYKLTQDSKTKIITVEMNGVKDYIPEKKDIVRVPSFKGSWEFIPIGRGIIKVIYQAHSETGGYVPASIANAACVDIPYNTLKNLKIEIEKPKYKNAVFEKIAEP